MYQFHAVVCGGIPVEGAVGNAIPNIKFSIV